MTDELGELKRAYREIKAPPHLGTRIRAEVGNQREERFHWMPIGASALAVVAVVWLLPVLWQQQSQVVSPPSKPSLASLAALAPQKPAVGSPSLTQLRSVSVPKAPTKPQTKNLKPQSILRNEKDLLEDRNNAYI